MFKLVDEDCQELDRLHVKVGEVADEMGWGGGVTIDNRFLSRSQ